MPTPEIAEAFARVTATRSRLAEITKNISGSGAAQVQLQSEWEEAFLAFVDATQVFSAVVKKNAEARKRAASPD